MTVFKAMNLVLGIILTYKDYFKVISKFSSPWKKELLLFSPHTYNAKGYKANTLKGIHVLNQHPALVCQ